MKVLIAGGGGYIGSFLAWHLRDYGFAVVVQDNWQGGEADRVRSFDVVSCPCDRKPEARTPFEHFTFDAVVFAVGPAWTPRPAVPPPELFLPSYVGSAVVLSEMCARFGVKHVVVLSDGAVYGDTGPEGVPEDAPAKSESLRSAGALACERIFSAYAACGSYAVTVLRLFGVAGADPSGGRGERHKPERHVIPCCLEAIRGNVPFTVWGTEYPTPDGTAARDYLHVLDVVEAVRLVLEKPQASGIRLYNICSGRAHTVRAVLKEAAEVTTVAPEIIEGPAAPQSPAWRVGNAQRLRKELGWKPLRSDLRSILESQWEFLQVEKPRELTETAERFGQVAVKLGFVTPEEVRRALAIQQEDARSGRPRRLLGLVLLEEGLIDNQQLIEILKYYERRDPISEDRSSQDEQVDSMEPSS